MIAEGRSGPQVIADGAVNELRVGKDTSLISQDGHARYVEPNYRNGIYSVCNSAAQALSLTGTTTYTGLVVYNAVGSGKYLSILTAAFAATIAEVGVGGVILFSQPIASALPTLTATNAANGPISNLLGGNTSSIAKVASSCTLASNPVFLRPLLGIPWVTGTAQAAVVVKDEIAGEIMIPPGAGIGIVAVTSAITGVSYLSWEEIPV